MFDIGWAELLVIGCLALIVVGPRDLPKLLRSFGQYAAQMRGMAREFQRSMEEAAREADITQAKELKQAAADLRSLTTMNLDSFGKPGVAQPAATPPAASTSPASTSPASPLTPPVAVAAAQTSPPAGGAA